MEIGNIVTYKNQGKYEVLRKDSEKTRTLFVIKDIDKGYGWCSMSQTYKGVHKDNGWYRGQNFDFGVEIVVHKKHLQLLTPKY